jgi:hypothetical protein
MEFNDYNNIILIKFGEKFGEKEKKYYPNLLMC